ncbi:MULTISPECIES: diguanylate cyclase [unclassified Lysobacter]|uniref:diguanylate cyclase n=1 Tax=unclassified Lysobacter TaxID=2635362 RepID=UPI0006FA1B27|nr:MULTISPECIES: diguanylate cyclase [unclassified Lysobacter]KRA16325.1 response regulator [Lysobacter sp. Root604]KRD32024.1 response regulator [Lysobacter sp. Root916]KRD75895.1 response regulator [Lysobacter sp. Root983]
MNVILFDVEALPGTAAASRRARLLVVDDQPINIRALHEVFSADHDVFMATNGAQALAFCRQTPPDLVLLDVVMPDLSGLEVCRALKADPETQSIPVIFVTSLDDPAEEAACWDAGGVDFITKPINALTVRNRVRAHLTLKQQSDLLRRMAWVDGLTGVANRRQFDERLAREWQRCRRGGQPLSAGIIDIDHFKAYNDTYGHLAGDDCLRQVAAAIESSLARPGDLVARTGGEEFTCLLPEIDLAGARVVVENVERAVRALGISHAASEHGTVTVSIGIATAQPAEEENAESLLNRADSGLYRAKRGGRARVRSDEDTPTAGA